MTNKEAITRIREHKIIHKMDEPRAIYISEALDMAIKALENQKIGHWIENAPEWQNIDPPYICSECGNFHLRKTNYCDQCGAKMIEQQK